MHIYNSTYTYIHVHTPTHAHTHIHTQTYTHTRRLYSVHMNTLLLLTFDITTVYNPSVGFEV